MGSLNFPRTAIELIVFLESWKIFREFVNDKNERLEKTSSNPCLSSQNGRENQFLVPVLLHTLMSSTNDNLGLYVQIK